MEKKIKVLKIVKLAVYIHRYFPTTVNPNNIFEKQLLLHVYETKLKDLAQD